jgi:V-type ATPase 116kDa subunit family
VVIAFICVPVMLLPKPFLLRPKKNSIHVVKSSTFPDQRGASQPLLQESKAQFPRESHEIDEQFGKDLALVASQQHPDIDQEVHHQSHDSHDDFSEIFVH